MSIDKIVAVGNSNNGEEKNKLQQFIPLIFESTFENFTELDKLQVLSL